MATRQIEINIRTSSGYDQLYPRVRASDVSAGTFNEQFTFGSIPLCDITATQYNHLVNLSTLNTNISNNIKLNLIGTYNITTTNTYIRPNLTSRSVIVVASTVSLKDSCRVYNSSGSEYAEINSNYFATGFIILNGSSGFAYFWGSGDNYPSIGTIANFQASYFSVYAYDTNGILYVYAF